MLVLGSLLKLYCLLCLNDLVTKFLLSLENKSFVFAGTGLELAGCTVKRGDGYLLSA